MVFRNKAVDLLRASRRHFRLGEMAADYLLDLEGKPPEHADTAVDRSERAAIVRRAVHSLPEEQRKCIEWAFLRGFTHVQLAELFGAPLGSVKTNIRRGLLRLRDILHEGGAP
jgi:RNA polymerase sigma-70 factor (ECF subfamily)